MSYIEARPRGSYITLALVIFSSIPRQYLYLYKISEVITVLKLIVNDNSLSFVDH